MKAEEFENIVKLAIDDVPQLMEERQYEIKETYEARDEMKYKNQYRSHCMRVQTAVMMLGVVSIVYAVYTMSQIK